MRREFIISVMLFVMSGVGSCLALTPGFFAPRQGSQLVDVRDGGDSCWVVESQKLSFGVAIAVSDFSWVVQLTNRSSEDLFIERIESSCSCSNVSTKSLYLSPGQTADLQLILDLQSVMRGGLPQSLHEFTTSLMLHYSQHGVRQEQPVRISGQVRVHPVSLVSGSLIWQIPDGGIEVNHSEYLELECQEPIGAVRVRCVPDVATVEVADFTRGQKTFRVRVTPKISLDSSARTFHVLVGVVSDAAQEFPDLAVSASVHILPQHRLNASVVLIGAQSVGETAVTEIHIHHQESRQMKRIAVDDGDVGIRVVSTTVLNSGHTTRLRVGIPITTMGDQQIQARVVIRSDEANQILASLPLLIKYRGVP